MQEFVSETLGGLHVHVHVWARPHYKQSSIHLCLVHDIDPQHVTEQALLPHLLLQGSQLHPSAADVQEALDALFGAELKVETRRAGSRFLTEYRLELVHERYAPGERRLLEEGLDLLHSLLLQPLCVDGVFAESAVQREKERHAQRIEAQDWDLQASAIQRLSQEMFAGTSLALPLQGTKDELQGITAESLWHRYQAWLGNAEIHVYVTGDYDTRYMIEQAAQRFTRERDTASARVPSAFAPASPEFTMIREEVEDISLLAVGLRCGEMTATEDYPLVVLLYNLLFVFPHSRLVIEMRQRRQLTYNIGSRLDEASGAMFMITELDPANWDTGMQLFQDTFRRLQTERIGEEELALIRRVSINNIRRRYLDVMWRMVDFHLKMTLVGRTWTVQEMCERFATATAEELQRVACAITIDSMLLAGEGVPA
jgi:predicted Zn-dependent peptidase